MFEDVTTRMQRINTKKMLIDPAYQRELNPTRVKKIASKFNPCLVNEVKVSNRDGKYYIFDGQHTAAVLKMRNGGDVDIDCKVFYGLSQKDEAELFAQQSGEMARRVESNAKMKALYTAGDVDIVELKNLVEKAGFIFDFAGYKTNKRICCCAQIYRIFRMTTCQEFRTILQIIMDSWNGEKDSLRREIIGGVAILYLVHKPNLDIDRMVQVFQKEYPNSILRAGKEFTTSQADIKYARALLRLYNKGRKAKHRLSEEPIIEFSWSKR